MKHDRPEVSLAADDEAFRDLDQPIEAGEEQDDFDDPKVLLELLSSKIDRRLISLNEEDLQVHSTDKWYASHPPQIVVFAESRDDVVAVMKFANQHNLPVTTRGAGVGYVGGCVPIHGGIALSVARMNKILELNPADGVAVVQPGVITGDLQKAAAELGWDYPPDPASLKECSLGGNIATNAGGPRCLKYGVTRSYVLGLEVVLPDGRVMRCGGRVHKNKTGFDLVGLFTGSEGMLGIVTEATLRLIPKPPPRAMLAAVFSEFPITAAAVQAILNAGAGQIGYYKDCHFRTAGTGTFTPTGKAQPHTGQPIELAKGSQHHNPPARVARQAVLRRGAGKAFIDHQ